MRLAIEKGFYKDQEQALADIRNMTIQSVGKGGIHIRKGFLQHGIQNLIWIVLDAQCTPVIVLITAVFIILMY